MALLNYTTNIEPEKTISEIQKMLSAYGIAAMMTEYDGPHVSSVSFKMMVDGKPWAYRLPCNWRSVLTVLNESKIPNRYKDNAQATRIAWRIIKNWVEVQLALVEVNMASIPQIFLPYAIMKDGRTLAEHVATDPKFLLGNGN